MKYRLVRMPRPCARETYDQAAANLTAHALSFPAVLAVYRMGNVSVPGISDLDIIVVLDDATPLPAFDFEGALTPEQRYPLMHSVFVVSALFWKNRHLFFTFDNLSLVAGRDIAACDLLPDWKTELALRTAAGHLVRVYFSLFSQLSARVLRVRSLLCELHALRFDVQPLKPFLNQEAARALDDMVRETSTIRQHWFEHEARSKQDFIALCRRARGVLKQVVEAVGTCPALTATYAGATQTAEAPGRLKLSRQRTLMPGSDAVEEYSTPASKLNAVLAQLPLSDDLLGKLVRRLGKHEVRIPAPVFGLVTGRATHRLSSTGETLVAAQHSILNSATMRAIRRRKYSLPTVLDPAYLAPRHHGE